MKHKILFIIFSVLCFFTLNANHLRDTDAPFLILRMMDTSSENFAYSTKLVETTKKYPNTFDEVWLCSKAYFPSIATIEADAKYLNELSALWKSANITPSYQIGATFGHGNVNKNEHGFTENAYRQSSKGNRLHMLCENSPEVKDYFCKRLDILIKNTNLKSIWYDDDFRMGLSISELCFCKYCMDKFNSIQNSNWNVKDLYTALVDSKKENIKLRKDWFNMRNNSLCDFAKEIAKVRDNASRECIISLQSINPHRYNCHNYPAIISGFASGKKAGIRIGSSAYNEFDNTALLHKLFGVMYETERCLRQNNIYQICYEAENYPHVATIKTPRAMMLECALMLAAGCDSLSVYWDNANYYEPISSYEKFVKTVNEYRPFLEKLGEFYKDTRLHGIARYIGNTMYVSPQKSWNGYKIESCPNEKEFALFSSGIPMLSTDKYADIIYLDDATISKLTDDELKTILSKNCLIEAHTIALLEKRNFDIGITAKPTNPSEYANGLFSEIHNGKSFSDYPGQTFYKLTPKNNNVKTISPIKSPTDEHAGLAFAVSQTQFGGKVFVVGGNEILRYSSAPRRTAFLDALDTLSPMPVRLETSHSIYFIPRVDKDNNFANAVIYNITKGDTTPIVLRIRSKNPVKYKLLRPLKDDVIIQSKKADNGDGFILTLPPLEPVSVCAIQAIE